MLRNLWSGNVVNAGSKGGKACGATAVDTDTRPNAARNFTSGAAEAAPQESGCGEIRSGIPVT